jgi:cytochrome c oxidase subunit 2
VLTVPVNRPVIVHLTSRDVVHSFTLNEMRVRQDATPGLSVRTWFTPATTGRWEIGCSQLCGLGHYRMRGAFAVLSADEWAAWQAREVALIPPAPR